jgi:uncharacterized protein YyaL (SSP411 family)
MENFKHTNRLIEETSPYLSSHTHQPVDWYTWSDEALDRAKKENKLLFISVGYSACHWCHVMSTECFENETIASILNKYYISILIDKEERPDLGQVYLNAVQLMTDNAGWPLNCFALPDGTPVFGGTYFTSSQFIDITQSLQDTYSNQYEKVKEVADDLREALRGIDVITEKEPSQKFSENDLKLIIEPWKRKFDNVNGGTQNPPKFPLPNGKEFLMWAAYYFDDEEIKNHLIVTLDKMAEGAIYDQVGGGFFRYAIDSEWKIPHFEKMLYDNVQLVSLYANGYRFSKNLKYKQIAEETITFILREMYSPDGVFYCSIDSDSDEGEGRYYMWTVQELKETLGEDFNFAADYYGIIKEVNHLDFTILYVAVDETALATKYKLTLEEAVLKIKTIKQKLIDARAKRQLPVVDKKLIASWNAMAITGLLNAYVAFDNEQYLILAKKTAKYIKNTLIYNDDHIYRCIISKEPVKGFLDDYAFLIKAFILLFQLTTDEEYIKDAKKLTDFVIEHFYDEQSGMFFFTSDEEESSLGRKMDFIDRAIPSADSELAQDLMLLAHIYNNVQYYNYARQMLVNIKSQMPGAGPFISNWAQLLFYYVYDPVIVKLSPKTTNAIKLVWEQFLPNIIIFPVVSGNQNPSFSSMFTQFFIDEDHELRLEDIERLRKVALNNKRKECITF